MMTNERQRAEFEAWAARIGLCVTGKYAETINGLCAESAFKAGYKAALQSQVKNDRTLFCDLKTDEEKSAFFLSGRGYETGVIALSIQNDVAMAYHRCAEYKKELEALQSQDREDEPCKWYNCPETDNVWDTDCGQSFEIYEGTPTENRMGFCCYCGKPIREAIDHARRVEENE